MSKKDRELANKSITAVFVVVVFLLMSMGMALVTAFLLVLAIYVVALIAYRLHRRSRLKALRLADVDNMPGLEFEKYVRELLKAQGYSVTLTPPSGDFGVDLIACNDMDKIAVQVKRYSNPVPPRAIGEVVGGMEYYGCNRTMVVTNSTYSRAAEKLAQANRCTLIDRYKLAIWINDFSSDKPDRTPRLEVPHLIVNLAKGLPRLFALIAVWLLVRPFVTVTHTADRQSADLPTAAALRVKEAPISTAAPSMTRQPIPFTEVRVSPTQTAAAEHLSVTVRVIADANLRAGPGTHFDVVGGVRSGTTIEVLPCDDTCDWYQVGAHEWIASPLVEDISERSHQNQLATITPLDVEVVLLPTPTFTPVPQ